MKLEEQVCSFDLAKRLKELGVKQESLFYWSQYMTRRMKAPKWRLMYGEHGTNWYSAFTVAELGEILPAFSKAYDCEGNAVMGNRKLGASEWAIGYTNIGNGHTHQEFAITEADARAKMLIYLLEKTLITP